MSDSKPFQTIHLTPPKIEFFMDIITHLKRDLARASGQIEVANAIIGKFMEQVSEPVARNIINEVHADFILKPMGIYPNASAPAAPPASSS
jgi:hypothetical protein